MPLSRKKSCARCRESKARCDRTIPGCSRCTLRHLKCVYDGRDAYRPAASSYPSQTQAAALLPTCAEPQPIFHQQLEMLEPWDTLLGGDNRDFDPAETVAGSSVQLCTWPEKDTPGSGVMAFNPSEKEGVGTRNDPWVLLQESEDTSATAIQRSIPPTISNESDNHSNALLKKNMFRSCAMSSILLGQMTSFPKLLIEGDRLPPFIHAPCHIDNELALECGERGSHQCLPRELAICAGLVEMFYSRTRANADFVWTAIYQERARLQGGWDGFTSMQQLAALQSLMVLLLLQASDPTTVEKNDSGLLLNTVMNCAASIARTHEWISEVRDAATNRREWVFRESIRRVIALIYMVESLLDGFVYSPSTTCSTGEGFRSVPLPSGRDLWEARTSRKWAQAYKQHVQSRTTDRVLTVGDAMDSGGVGITVGSRANPAGAALLPEVMKWAEGLDSLGMLVWMVLPFEDVRARMSQEAMSC